MSSTYILPVGKDDDERLSLQSKSLDEITHNHILRSNIRKDFVVADIGCGNGEMVLWFLGKVATIYAIDASDEQLELTKQKVQSNKENSTTKVKYIKLDITNTEQVLSFHELIGKIDLIFMRLVLMHVPVVSYQSTLNNLSTLLKSGGKIVSEETVWDTIYCNYHEEIVNKYKSIMLNEAASKGLDYNIGKYINKLFIEAGFQVDEYNIITRPIAPTILAKMFVSLVNILMAKHTDSESQLMYKDWINKVSTMKDDDPGLIVRTSGMSVTTCTKI